MHLVKSNLNNREFGLSTDENQVLREFMELNIAALPQKKMILTDEELFEIDVVCKENIVNVKNYFFLIVNNKPYYIFESNFTEKDDIEYTLTELPPDMSNALIEIHRSN